MTGPSLVSDVTHFENPIVTASYSHTKYHKTIPSHQDACISFSLQNATCFHSHFNYTHTSKCECNWNVSKIKTQLIFKEAKHWLCVTLPKTRKYPSLSGQNYLPHKDNLVFWKPMALTNWKVGESYPVQVGSWTEKVHVSELMFRFQGVHVLLTVLSKRRRNQRFIVNLV